METFARNWSKKQAFSKSLTRSTMEFINGMYFGSISGALVILLSLLITSYFFNREIEKEGNRLEGWDWLLVVIGVTYTQVGIGLLDILLDWNAFFIGMLAYSVSGFPMV